MRANFRRHAVPIDVRPYVEDFLQDAKPAVKRLTKHIEQELRKVTVNAEDWCAPTRSISRILTIFVGSLCMQQRWHVSYFGLWTLEYRAKVLGS